MADALFRSSRSFYVRLVLYLAVFTTLFDGVWAVSGQKAAPKEASAEEQLVEQQNRQVNILFKDAVDHASRLYAAEKESNEEYEKFAARLLELQKISPEPSTKKFNDRLNKIFCRLETAWALEKAQRHFGGQTAAWLGWLVERCPSIIYDDLGMFLSLPDYSFMQGDVFTPYLRMLLANIDLRSNKAFMETAPISILFAALRDNPAIGSKCSEKRLKELVTAYSLEDASELYWLVASVPALRSMFSLGYDSHSLCGLMGAIRSDGLTSDSLASLLRHVIRLEAELGRILTDVAAKWRECCKLYYPDIFNSHWLRFVKLAGELHENRKMINDLYQEIENGIVPNKIGHDLVARAVKVLLRAPYLEVAQRTLNARARSLQPPANTTERFKSVVAPLPNMDNCDVLDHPNLMGSLWRNLFYTNGEDWSEESASDSRGTHLRKWPLFYDNDLVSSTNICSLLQEWIALSACLPPQFATGDGLLQFLSVIQVPKSTNPRIDSLRIAASDMASDFMDKRLRPLACVSAESLKDLSKSYTCRYSSPHPTFMQLGDKLAAFLAERQSQHVWNEHFWWQLVKAWLTDDPLLKDFSVNNYAAIRHLRSLLYLHRLLPFPTEDLRELAVHVSKGASNVLCSKDWEYLGVDLKPKLEVTQSPIPVLSSDAEKTAFKSIPSQIPNPDLAQAGAIQRQDLNVSVDAGMVEAKTNSNDASKALQKMLGIKNQSACENGTNKPVSESVHSSKTSTALDSKPAANESDGKSVAESPKPSEASAASTAAIQIAAVNVPIISISPVSEAPDSLKSQASKVPAKATFVSALTNGGSASEKAVAVGEKGSAVSQPVLALAKEAMKAPAQQAAANKQVEAAKGKPSPNAKGAGQHEPAVPTKKLPSALANFPKHNVNKNPKDRKPVEEEWASDFEEPVERIVPCSATELRTTEYEAAAPVADTSTSSEPVKAEDEEEDDESGVDEATGQKSGSGQPKKKKSKKSKNKKGKNKSSVQAMAQSGELIDTWIKQSKHVPQISVYSALSKVDFTTGIFETVATLLPKLLISKVDKEWLKDIYKQMPGLNLFSTAEAKYRNSHSHPFLEFYFVLIARKASNLPMASAPVRFAIIESSLLVSVFAQHCSLNLSKVAELDKYRPLWEVVDLALFPKLLETEEVGFVVQAVGRHEGGVERLSKTCRDAILRRTEDNAELVALKEKINNSSSWEELMGLPYPFILKEIDSQFQVLNEACISYQKSCNAVKSKSEGASLSKVIELRRMVQNACYPLGLWDDMHIARLEAFPEIRDVLTLEPDMLHPVQQHSLLTGSGVGMHAFLSRHPFMLYGMIFNVELYLKHLLYEAENSKGKGPTAEPDPLLQNMTRYHMSFIEDTLPIRVNKWLSAAPGLSEVPVLLGERLWLLLQPRDYDIYLPLLTLPILANGINSQKYKDNVLQGLKAQLQVTLTMNELKEKITGAMKVMLLHELHFIQFHLMELHSSLNKDDPDFADMTIRLEAIYRDCLLVEDASLHTELLAKITCFLGRCETAKRKLQNAESPSLEAYRDPDFSALVQGYKDAIQQPLSSLRWHAVKETCILNSTEDGANVRKGGKSSKSKSDAAVAYIKGCNLTQSYGNTMSKLESFKFDALRRFVSQNVSEPWYARFLLVNLVTGNGTRINAELTVEDLRWMWGNLWFDERAMLVKMLTFAGVDPGLATGEVDASGPIPLLSNSKTK